MELMFALMYALGCAAWCAHLAENRGRNPVPWGFLGLFTGVIGVIIAALTGRTAEAEARRLDAVEAARVQPTTATPSTVELEKLAELHRAGELDDVEYAAAKRRALGLQQ